MLVIPRATQLQRHVNCPRGWRHNCDAWQRGSICGATDDGKRSRRIVARDCLEKCRRDRSEACVMDIKNTVNGSKNWQSNVVFDLYVWACNYWSDRIVHTSDVFILPKQMWIESYCDKSQLYWCAYQLLLTYIAVLKLCNVKDSQSVLYISVVWALSY